MECPNCHHRNERTEPANGNPTSSMNDFVFVIFLVLVIIFFLFILLGMYMYDYYAVLPKTQARFSTVALAASGLDANATSYPVLHVVFHFESTTGSKNMVCLQRGFASVSSSGILLGKTYSEQMLCSKGGQDNTFVTKLAGMAVSIPSFNEKNALFDVEMKLDGRNTDFILQKYHVLCKNVTLKAMDSPVLCDTTLLIQGITGKEKKY